MFQDGKTIEDLSSAGLNEIPKISKTPKKLDQPRVVVSCGPPPAPLVSLCSEGNKIRIDLPKDYARGDGI